MRSKEGKIIKIIQRFSPRDFGIRNIYYKTDEGVIEMVFFIEKDNASRLITYINSLSSILEKEVKDIKVESSVYIYQKSQNLSNFAKKEKLKSINLKYVGINF